MKITLVVNSKSASITENDLLTFNEEQCVIGRHRCQIWLADARCSRRHALLYEDPHTGLRVRDLKSSNGTYVNGRRIVDAPVVEGDVICVGNTRMRVLEYRSELNRDSRPALPHLDTEPPLSPIPSKSIAFLLG